MDNGTNFAVGALAKYCKEVGTRLDLASVAHPQSNGQVERMNGLILQGLKPRLEEPLHRAAWGLGGRITVCSLEHLHYAEQVTEFGDEVPESRHASREALHVL